MDRGRIVAEGTPADLKRSVGTDMIVARVDGDARARRTTRGSGGQQLASLDHHAISLFAVALPAVGVMDMLRFHKFTAGRFWTDDYGSSDNAEEFRAWGLAALGAEPMT